MNNSFCPGCGSKIEDTNSQFCTSCGYNFGQQSQMFGQSANNQNIGNNDINNNFTTYNGVKTYTNSMAIVGLVISIVSLIFCCGSVSIIGLIFSIIGLNKAKQNNNIGKGIGIAGLVVNILGILLLIFWSLLVFLPFFITASEIENYATSVIGLLF